METGYCASDLDLRTRCWKAGAYAEWNDQATDVRELVGDDPDPDATRPGALPRPCPHGSDDHTRRRSHRAGAAQPGLRGGDDAAAVSPDPVSPAESGRAGDVL